MLERAKKKGKKRKPSSTPGASADTKRQSKQKSERKLSKKDRKDKKGTKRKKNKKDKKDKKGMKKDGKGKDKNKKGKRKTKKKSDKDKSKKHKDKGGKAKKGDNKHKKGKSGKGGKKKKGKDKSKNANEQHKNTNVSYPHDAELDRKDVEHEVSVTDEHECPELGLLPRRKSRPHSVRAVRTCDQHLRWQDESTDTRLLHDNTAQGDSNIKYTSLHPFLLEEKDTNKCRKNRKSASFDASVMSSGDCPPELMRHARRNRLSDTEKRDHYKHLTRKNRSRIHAMLSSDYILNQNRDSRNLKNSAMLIDKRDRFLSSVSLDVVSDMHLLKPITNVEDRVCKKRVSINNFETGDFPTRSHNCAEIRRRLRVRSEHSYKIHKHPDSETQTAISKQGGPNFQDETYTLNTEAPDCEWEKQYGESGDLTVDNRNGSCMSTVEPSLIDETLIGGVEECVGASTADITIYDSSQDITKEHSAHPFCDRSGHLLAGKSHTSVSSMKTKDISSPSTSKEPQAEDDQKAPLNGRKKTVSRLRNSSILKRMTSLMATILDYNTSAVGIRRFGRMKGFNENFKVYRPAILAEPQKPNDPSGLSKLTEKLNKSVTEQQQLLKLENIEPEPVRVKAKSKYNLGEVLFKAKEQRIEKQKRDLRKQLKSIKKVKVPQDHKESQTENKESLASKLCPFCKISFEFGVP